MNPGFVCATTSAHLGDDHQFLRIGMQRASDDLIGDVWSIEIARIDVIYTSGDRFAQHGDGRVRIARRSEYAGPGELHRAVTHPLHSQRTTGKRETAAELGSFLSSNPTHDA